MGVVCGAELLVVGRMFQLGTRRSSTEESMAP